MEEKTTTVNADLTLESETTDSTTVKSADNDFDSVHAEIAAILDTPRPYPDDIKFRADDFCFEHERRTAIALGGDAEHRWYGYWHVRLEWAEWKIPIWADWKNRGTHKVAPEFYKKALPPPLDSYGETHRPLPIPRLTKFRFRNLQAQNDTSAGKGSAFTWFGKKQNSEKRGRETTSRIEISNRQFKYVHSELFAWRQWLAQRVSEAPPGDTALTQLRWLGLTAKAVEESLKRFAFEIQELETDFSLPPLWEVWDGSMDDLWAGRVAPPPLMPYRWSDFPLRFVHWVMEHGMPLLPDDLVRPNYREFSLKPLPQIRSHLNNSLGSDRSDIVGKPHCRFERVFGLRKDDARVARRMGLPRVQGIEWDRAIHQICFSGGTLSLGEINSAVGLMKLAVDVDWLSSCRLLERYVAIHPSDNLLFDIERHTRKLRVLYRVLIFAMRYLDFYTELNRYPLPTPFLDVPPWEPWFGDVLEDPRGDPRSQADIVIGGRLSEYVFYLIALVNRHGVPEPSEPSKAMLERARTWEAGLEPTPPERPAAGPYYYGGTGLCNFSRWQGKWRRARRAKNRTT